MFSCFKKPAATPDSEDGRKLFHQVRQAAYRRGWCLDELPDKSSDQQARAEAVGVLSQMFNALGIGGFDASRPEAMLRWLNRPLPADHRTSWADRLGRLRAGQVVFLDARDF